MTLSGQTKPKLVICSIQDEFEEQKDVFYAIEFTLSPGNDFYHKRFCALSITELGKCPGPS